MALQDIVNTSHAEDTVTCEYADIYLDNDFCNSTRGDVDIQATNDVSRTGINEENNVWISHSDNLINIVDLQPPFTSKVTRAKTHEGILSIGDNILENDRKMFYNYVENLLKDNDDLWSFILQNEKKGVIEKIHNFYQEIFRKKKAIMRTEISSFYQKTLTELEAHMKSEIKIEAQSLYISMINRANNEIQQQLRKERRALEKTLDEQFNKELNNVNTYYELLLKHEKSKYNKLKNKLIQEKNDALKAFYKQMEAERHTSTMYVLSIERKKCRMRKMLLETLQNAEVMNHIQKLKERDSLLENLEKKEVPVSVLNKQWEERIVKILQLFLKFISFCLKLLPEQTTFLLDFEKMVILQLCEMQKQPHTAPLTLITDQDEMNVFRFHQTKSESSVCDKEPFSIVGDLSTPPPLLLAYGSRETIDSEVDLPHFRVQRRYVYAKCHGFEEIKKVLEKDLCNCNEYISHSRTSSRDSLKYKKILDPVTSSPEIVSLNEKLEHKEINRLQECPDACEKFLEFDKDFTFLNSYLDFTEENFEKLKTRTFLEQAEITETVKIKDIAFDEVPFSATGEKFTTIGTQCSSEDDIHVAKSSCPCGKRYEIDSNELKEVKIQDALVKRQRSLNRLLQDNPKLINVIFSDECYDDKI